MKGLFQLMTADKTRSLSYGIATNFGAAHGIRADPAFGAITNLGAVSLSRHAQTLLYESFRHAQGNQPAQVHFMKAYALLLRQTGVEIDFSLKDRLAHRIRSKQVPIGHMDIPNLIQVRAQFEFWWLIMWDIFSAIYLTDSQHLPTREKLDRRAIAVGGTCEMSSFTGEEMEALSHAFTPYRVADFSTLRPSEIVNEYFLPNLIRVERNFQGHGSRYATRPRTDGGDVHESKMFDHCAKAVRRLQRKITGPIDLIYVYVCERLDWLSRNQPDNPVYVDYLSLIDFYNTNHPHAPATALHTAIHPPLNNSAAYPTRIHQQERGSSC